MRVKIRYTEECEVEGKTVEEVQNVFENMCDSNVTFIEVISATDENGNDVKDLLGYWKELLWLGNYKTEKE